jgi:hypothetical protein
MNENPDDFMMHNRFLPKTDSFASIYESTDEDGPNP